MNKADQIIIAFDLHGVIFTFDYKKLAKLLWNYNHKLAFIATAFHVTFAWQILKMLWHSATDEEFYKLFKKHRTFLFPIIFEMTNAQKIITGMDKLIQELSQYGYKLHVVSNIGPNRFKQLSNDFPQIINQFSKIKIVQPDGPQARIRKPDPQFFYDYLHEYRQQNQNIIFIDDNKKNIGVAQSLGIDTILFKSANQLRNQLKQLNIL